ncbi:T9SS type A sorting domain-containing protein [Tamlana crocina]
MKYFCFSLLALFFAQCIFSQNISFEDPNFKNALIVLGIDTNGDNEIQISEAQSTTSLDLSSLNIASLMGISQFEYDIYHSINSMVGIEKFINLKTLICKRNNIETLDVSLLLNLETLDCYGNRISSLTLNDTNSLLFLDLSANRSYSILESNISKLTNLKTLKSSSNQISDINISTLANLEELNLYNNKLTTLDISSLTKLKKLTCNYNQLTNLDVSNLIDLENLTCNYNLLNNLMVGGLTKITRLICNNNKINNLDISSAINLDYLNCDYNELASLNVDNLYKIKTINCSNNQISSLNVENLNALQSLKCSFNNLTSLDVSNLEALEFLHCNDNKLESLSIENSNVALIKCHNNNLTELDCTTAYNLDHLECNDNKLVTLFLKNGINETTFNESTTTINFENNPNLEYICADDFEISKIQELIDLYGYSGCEVNTYCSFTPGGESFVIEGQNILNQNGGDCSDAVPFYANVKYNVSSSEINGQFISNFSGSFKTSVNKGSYSVTPILENPEFFKISPEVLTVNFPDDGFSVAQNFCITPNGTYNDLEVIIIPITRARPGFNSEYKIIYKNKGNQTLSGSIEIDFQDDILDLTSSSPEVSTQSNGSLTWNYSNLQPFQSNEISIIFNINTPLETPSVNDGDILNFTASISPITGDYTETDNTFTLNQTVVNSFDPNDKTCLEGNTITPDLIGNYVHYLIRCENTGSAEAVNVIVKDVIDGNKLDINSLMVTGSSHPMVTEINGDNVEFIFEEINLPFDDANNDGYVSFKIKTLPTLQIGDIFENEAEIYFDYNAPIITNKYATKISNSLSNSKNHDVNCLSLYPNPSEDKISVNTKRAIELISFYDVWGQLVLQIPFPEYTMNTEVSTDKLSSGNYFVKVKTNLGNHTIKFTKK